MRKQTCPASARPSPFAPPKRRCSGGVSSTAEAARPRASTGHLSTGSCSGSTAEVGTVLPGDLRGAAESNGSGALRDAPGRHRRAHRHRLQKPLRGAFFRRPAKPNDTSLPLPHQRSFDSRSDFYWSSAADSPKAVLPDLRKGGVQCQHIKSCKNDSWARSIKVPRSGRFEAKYAPCAAAVRRFRRLLQGIVQTPSGS